MKRFFNNYFSFKGSANRLRYFIYLTILGIISLLAGFTSKGHIFSLPITDTYITQILYYLLDTIIFISRASLSVRRLHDLNITGWLILVSSIFSFIPVLNIISIIFGFYLLVESGTKGANKFGSDPIERKQIT